LLGESAADSRLHDVLKNVLGEQYERLLAATGQSDLGPILDPHFAASRGVAFDC